MGNKGVLQIYEDLQEREIETLGKLQYQKLGLMQDLLTGNVPVKVDTPVAEVSDG